MTNPTRSETRNLAKRLLADETAAAMPAVESMPVAFRVCEKLRDPLIMLAGAAGFHSLLSRAVTLAKREAPSLREVQVNSDGLLEYGDRQPHLEKNDAEAGVVLVAQLLGLLFTFIGDALTVRLIQDLWSDESSGSLTAEGTGTYEPQR